MNHNKTHLLAVRISEAEHKSLLKVARHKKKSIPVLIREFISVEDLKLLHNEQSQETLFEISEREKQGQIQRAITSLATLTMGMNIKDFDKFDSNVVKINVAKKLQKNIEKSKRKKGIKQNE